MKIIYSNKIRTIVIVAILIVLNGYLNLRAANLFVTIPEILTVLFLLSMKETEKALFWHTIFFITSYSNIFTEDFLLFYNLSNISFNYAHFNFHGLRYSLIITYLIIFVQNSYKKTYSSSKQTVFFKLYKFFLYCVITGFILGSLGLLILDYSYRHYLLYGYYILFCFGFAYSYLNEYETRLKDNLYEIIPYIIAIAIVFNFLCSILELRQNLIVIGSTGIDAYCFILVPLLLFRKNILPVLIIVGLQLFLMSFNTSGKQIYSMFFLFVAALVLSFRKSIRANIGGANLGKIRLLFILVLIGYSVLEQNIFSMAEDNEGNYERKMESVESLSNFFIGEGKMTDVSDSPYIRLSEISNILYEDIRNPLFLLFGRGFGGYYRDELNLFSGYNLANGAFSREEIKSGLFSSGHDTFVTVPMLNGFIGFFMLISFIILCCKKSSQNYLYLTSLMFPMLWFYFDILMGVVGVMLLFAAEHKVQKT